MPPPRYPSDLSDEEWRILEPLLSRRQKSAAVRRNGRLSDRDGGRRLLEDARDLSRMGLLWADGAYTGGFREWLRRQLGWRLEVPHQPDRQLWRYGLGEKPRGFKVLPRRSGRGADLCVAGSITAFQQGLRESARDRGCHDLWRDEQVDVEEVGASSMKRSRLVFAFAKLPLRGCLKSPSRSPEAVCAGL